MSLFIAFTLCTGCSPDKNYLSEDTERLLWTSISRNGHDFIYTKDADTATLRIQYVYMRQPDFVDGTGLFTSIQNRKISASYDDSVNQNRYGRMILRFTIVHKEQAYNGQIKVHAEDKSEKANITIADQTYQKADTCTAKTIFGTYRAKATTSGNKHSIEAISLEKDSVISSFVLDGKLYQINYN